MFQSLLATNVLVGALLAIVALIIVDLVTRIGVALAKGSFSWWKILDFLRTNVIPYVLAWGAIETLLYAAQHVAFPSEVLTPFTGLAAIIYALIIARLIASILGNLRELGIPAPTQ